MSLNASISEPAGKEGPHRQESETSDRLLEFRDRFPILSRTNYLISNSLGAVPESASASLQAYYETWATRGVCAWEEAWWSLGADLGDLVAPLIGAAPGEVVFQPNVTLTHAVVFSAVRFPSKPESVPDRDRRHALPVDPLPDRSAARCRPGSRSSLRRTASPSTPARWSTRSTSGRPWCASPTSSSSRPTFMTIAAIAEKARRVGAITVIDGYQAVGTIPVDVRALGIDVYIGGCLKWLCGGPGAAFLWVDPDHRGRLEPAVDRLDGS